jgi:Icc-related predicted phosphoesterase
MKILAFVDLHGSKALLRKIAALARKEKVSYVVCAGDITIFGDSMKHLLKELDDIKIPVLIIHGNHENESLLRKACKESKNITFLHKAFHEHEDYVFAGFGGGGFSVRDEEFEIWSHSLLKKIGEDKKIILITHAPPYGTKLDLILDQPAGNKSIRQFIKMVQPALVISGHLHENAGTRDNIDKTFIINPGPWGVVLTV